MLTKKGKRQDRRMLNLLIVNGCIQKESRIKRSGKWKIGEKLMRQHSTLFEIASFVMKLSEGKITW